MAEPEETLSSERVFAGRRFGVRVDRVRLADGTETVRAVAESANAVVIVAVDDDQNLLLVRQYRFAVGRELLELPAGLIEGDDAPPTNGRRAETAEALSAGEPSLPTLEAAEHELITRALKFFEGNRRQTAKALGISERTLYRKLKELDEDL